MMMASSVVRERPHRNSAKNAQQRDMDSDDIEKTPVCSLSMRMTEAIETSQIEQGFTIYSGAQQ